jgi:ferredoxin
MLAEAKFEVTLISEEHNIDTKIFCGPEEYILDSAEGQGVDLPYSCRAGACSTCAGKILGDDLTVIDQSEQTFLDDDQVAAGFILTCISYAKNDCKILVHQEDSLY